MILKEVVIGREVFFVEGENLAEAASLANQYFRDVTSRLRNPFEQDRNENDVILDDVFLSVRENDGKEYWEWKSPTLGYAYKRMSAPQEKGAIPFIAFMTPWARWNKEDKVTEILYTAVQLENSAERGGELEDLGFTTDDAAKWVPAERVNIKGKWVWKAM